MMKRILIGLVICFVSVAFAQTPPPQVVASGILVFQHHDPATVDPHSGKPTVVTLKLVDPKPEVALNTPYPFWASFFVPATGAEPRLEAIVVGSSTTDDYLLFTPTVLPSTPAPG